MVASVLRLHARKGEVDAKRSVEEKKPEAAPKPAAKAAAQPAEKNARIQPPAPPEAVPTPAPSSRSGTKSPAKDPPKDPRLVGVEVQETKGQRRSAEDADVDGSHELLIRSAFYVQCRQSCKTTMNGARDNISGKPLDTDLVQAACREECDVITSMGVWEVIDRPPGEKIITTRWVDVNKGDAVNSTAVDLLQGS